MGKIERPLSSTKPKSRARLPVHGCMRPPAGLRMVAKSLALFTLLAIPVRPRAAPNSIAVAGTMVHFNFGNQAHAISYGLEFSEWYYASWPVGLDVGAEYGGHRFRIYTEGETGIGVTGAAWGPVVEFSPGKNAALGIQTSLWANFFGGIDFRWRFLDHKTYYCPGVYAKIPLVPGELDSLSADGENHHHHHFHWGD